MSCGLGSRVRRRSCRNGELDGVFGCEGMAVERGICGDEVRTKTQENLQTFLIKLLCS